MNDSFIKSIYTIGYTKKSLEEFASLIIQNNITKIIDVRLKTNSQLAGFAKASDLKYILENFLHIEYFHEPKLSPTEDIFKKYRTDKNWDEYVTSFNELMKERKINEIIDCIISDSNAICLLCSEDTPDKCHRRLIVEYYKQFNNLIKIKHLTKNEKKKIVKRKS
jgi:uncharacterized protein (DUF488 family)